jgi:excisionase family DNA binding protein
MLQDRAVGGEHDDDGEEAALRVGEVAERLGVSASTIRLWERRFRLPLPVRSAGGHRRYRAADVDQLRAVRDIFGRGHPLGRPIDDAERSDMEAILATTRALLRARTPSEVRDLLVAFVRVSGGDVVTADRGGPDALPFDLSFGEGAPLLPTAEKPSVVRLRLERTLPAVHEDARRVVALLRAAADAKLDRRSG